jgi:hypothetical protein
MDEEKEREREGSILLKLHFTRALWGPGVKEKEGEFPS